MKKFFLLATLIFSSQAQASQVCVTTLFAPAGEIDGLNDDMLQGFDINISHFVLTDESIRFYGPEDPTAVASRSGQRVLKGEHKVIKINDTTYNLADSGQPLIRPVNDGGFWKFGFHSDFYKQYEPRAWESILRFCMQSRERSPLECVSFSEDVFQAYVAPVSSQGCVDH